MNISQFSHNRADKPFHSSGYANVSRGDAIGSMNTQSFGQRTDMERNRSSISGYRASMVGQSYVHREVDSRDGATRPTMRPASYQQRTASVRPQPRPAFREPPTRYNPYG